MSTCRNCSGFSAKISEDYYRPGEEGGHHGEDNVGDGKEDEGDGGEDEVLHQWSRTCHLSCLSWRSYGNKPFLTRKADTFVSKFE